MDARKRGKRHEVEVEQGWISEAETIPYIQFPPDWQIKVIPPFSDTLIRFRVLLPSGLEKSVFLDTRCSLENYFDENRKPIPYWEVAPIAGMFGRCGKYDIEILLEMIAYEDEGLK